MSFIVKERLKRLKIELDKQERAVLDQALVHFKQTDCDTAIEQMTDEQVIQLAEKIIKRRKKRPIVNPEAYYG